MMLTAVVQPQPRPKALNEMEVYVVFKPHPSGNGEAGSWVTAAALGCCG